MQGKDFSKDIDHYIQKTQLFINRLENIFFLHIDIFISTNIYVLSSVCPNICPSKQNPQKCPSNMMLYALLEEKKGLSNYS